MKQNVFIREVSHKSIARMFLLAALLVASVHAFAQDSTSDRIETPHISAEKGAFAKTVLMPGDPLRAKYIAENFLDNPQLITSVRNMLGYTGTYKGVRVSVMGSGMGIPSMGIYSWELYSVFGVENIIRVGSAGSYKESMGVMDVTLVESSVSESTYARVQGGVTDTKMYPSQSLNDAIRKKATELAIYLKQSTAHTSDVFYTDPSQGSWQEIAERMGADCVEMECFALFHNANVLNKHAAALLTISNSFVNQNELTPDERETSFTEMIRLALETAVTLDAASNLSAPDAVTTVTKDGKYLDGHRVIILSKEKKYSITGIPEKLK